MQAAQALSAHVETYPKVEEASKTAWLLWQTIGRTAPDGWRPRVLTEYHNKHTQLYQESKVASTAIEDTFQMLLQHLAKHAQHLGHQSHTHPQEQVPHVDSPR